jgi:hypothetical protein
LGLVSPTQSNSGDTIEAADINDPVNQLAAVINGNIEAANLASSAVTTVKIADATVTNAKLATTAGEVGGAWTTWTPTWTNLTVSGSTVTARYTQQGKTVRFRVAVVLGGGNAPTGSVSFTLPVTAAAHAGTASLPPIGQVVIFDSGTASYDGFIAFNSTTTAVIYVIGTSSTYAATTSLSSTVPIAAYANGDEILINGCYEAA